MSPARSNCGPSTGSSKQVRRHRGQLEANIDVGRLQYLLAAAEIGSFRRAAEILGVHQSSVSRAAQQLEELLGVSLFERGHFGVRLTQAGHRFLADAMPAVEQLDAARRSAGAVGRAEVGIVRVGIFTSLAGGFLRQLLHCYSSRFPSVSIDVHDGGRREHLAAVRTHRLDIAFITGAGPIEKCETAELWRERVYVAMPSDHPLAAKDRIEWNLLQNAHFIVSRSEPGPEVHSYIMRRSADFSTYPNIEEKAVLQDTLMNLVALGQGITLVSAAWNSVAVPGLVLRPLTAAEDIVPFSAVWSPKNDNPALRRLLSVAHILAGRWRKGSSDWATETSFSACMKQLPID